MSDNTEKTSPEESGESETEEPKTKVSGPETRRRKVFTVRKALIATAVFAAGIFVVFVVGALLFRTGVVDEYIEGQFIAAFNDMGVEMKADRFEVTLSPFGLNLNDAVFTNSKNKEKLVSIKNARLEMSVMDLYALSSIRNVSIDRATLSGTEVWINFDENGVSNYEGIEITAPNNAVRFQYAASDVSIRESVIHFGDQSRSISGNAKDLSFFLNPDDPGREADSTKIAYLFELTSNKSNFIYDKSVLDPVDVKATGRLHEEGADIKSLSLKTPVGTTFLSGKVTDWSRLLYDLKVRSTIDLTQASNIFPMGTAISGVGNFDGRIKGEGENYKIVGEVNSDSLAASNIRLKALRVTADVDGEGLMYKANGKAVAELLTFEDFRIEFPSLVGNIRGNGTDFKWFGALQAAAVNSPLGTIGSLIISDSVAEYEDNKLIATFGNFRARKFTNDSVNLESIATRNIRLASSNGVTNVDIPTITADKLRVSDSNMRGVRVDSAKVVNQNGTTDIRAATVRVNEIESGDTRVRNTSATNVVVNNKRGISKVTAGQVRADQVLANGTKTSDVVASGVTVDSNGSVTKINSRGVKIARVETDAAILANLNVAGVRLTVREGTIEGQTNDFDAGRIDLRNNGEINAVKIRKPVFVLEPSGRYRASMDMSLGSGVIGSVRLGSARAAVVANNESIELNKLNAEVMDGNIDGNARIALTGNRSSAFNADFSNLDISKLLALQGGKIIPIEGRTGGRAELTFRGTDFRRASGSLTAQIEANAGTTDRGFIPVSGRVGVSAINGLFDIDYANLNTENSTLTADGRFDLIGSDSNLLLALNSSDASEIERIVRVLNVSPELEEQLNNYQVSLRGALAFTGNLSGRLENPTLAGRASLSTLVVRGKDLGSIVSNINASPETVQFKDGILQARDGGSVAFSVDMPASGSNNIEVQAKLNEINLANIVALLPVNSLPDQLRDIQGKTTGNLNLTGLPNEMRGEANLFAKNGSVNGQSFANLDANALFEGTEVRLTKFDAGFGNGNLSATGFYRSDSTEFKVNLAATSIPAEKILAFLPTSTSLPDIDGRINLTAEATGRSSDTASYNVNFEGAGENVRINESTIGRIDFVGKTENQLLNANINTNFAGRKQIVTAIVNFADERLPFTAETTLDRAPISPYLAIFRKADPDSVEIRGDATGRIDVKGFLTAIDSNGTRYFSTENLKGNANLSSVGLRFDETPLTSTEPVKVSFSTSEIVFENAKFAGGGSNVVVSGTKAFTDAGINNLAIDGKISLNIVRAFARNTFKNIFLNGIADVAVRLSGVNKTSRLNGTAIVENGSAATFVGSSRISFDRLSAQIRFTTNQVQIDQVSAFLGGGKLTASGGALLTDRLALDRIRLDVRGNNVTVPIPTDFITTGNANVQINGRLEGNDFDTLISGTVIARRSDYRKDIDLADLISGRSDAGIAQSADTSTGGGVNYNAPRFDIRIIGRDALRIRNNLADLSASADLRVTGDTDEPKLLGRITANSGTIFFRNDRYDVQRGVLTFPPNSNLEPRINLQAEAEIKGYQIFVNLSGDLSDTESLNAVLSSNPSLPQGDIASLITTGNLSNTSDGIPTLAQGGLNTAAEILTDEIINKPIARATDKLFGLNRFELDPIVSGQRGNPTARLTVGRQINKNLLATYSTNLSQDQNQVLALEYRVSNRLSFVAAYEQRSLSNVTQNRNEFRFEIRLRKRF